MPPRLPLQVFKLRFITQRSARFSEFPGFVWRGALGNRLRDLACVVRQPECHGCVLIDHCVYPYLFETPPPRDSSTTLLKDYPTAPLPFVLAPMHPWTLAEQQTLILHLTVIGDASRYTPYLLLALQQVGQKGLGAIHTRLTLNAIEQETIPGSGQWISVYADQRMLALSDAQAVTVPPVPQQALVSLLTPTRIRIQGHYMQTEHWNFAALFTTLMRRISLLARCHTTAIDEVNYKQLAKYAAELHCTADDLVWHDWRRRSSRQKSSIPMGGVSGQLHLEGEGLAALWPWLWIGQWVHLGKGAAMGLGRYRIEPG